MTTVTSKADSESRVVLPKQFADRQVELEVVSPEEVRIRLAPAKRKRPSLNELIERITDENLPEKIDFGPPVGKELL